MRQTNRRENVSNNEYWEDRLVREGTHDKAVAALEKFRKSNKRRGAQLDLYDDLTNLGVSPEEADEIVNLEIENPE
jgi:hypothetical protein